MDTPTTTTETETTPKVEPPRSVDSMLNPDFQVYCEKMTADGDCTNQVQDVLLGYCHRKAGNNDATYVGMVQDLMVFLVFERGMNIGAVTYRIRGVDRGFAIRVAAEAARRREAEATQSTSTKTEGVAA